MSSIAGWRALLAVGIAGTALIVLAPRRGPDVRAGDAATLVRVERGSFEVRVRLVGELQPVRSTMLSSGIRSDRGKIIELVDDGAQVAAGDVLVRFDPTPFEEEAGKTELEVALAESVVDARRQALEWERSQAERRVLTAKYELEVAALEEHRFDKGEGPLELARLEGELAEREDEWEQQSGFLGELEALRERGHVNDAEIAQVEKRAEKAQRTSNLARQQYETYRKFILPSRKAALKQKVEQADMEQRQTQVSSAFKIGEAQASLDQAERDLEAARVRFAEAEAELERTVLRAPQPGMAVLRVDYREGERRKPRVGDPVWQNQPLLYLPDLSHMQVATQVREVDVHLVRPGNDGSVHIDAYPELALPARVRAIGVLAARETESSGGEKFIRVTVDLEESDERLRPGMTARVDLLSQAVDDVLIVPIQAVWSRGSEQWCWVRTADGFEQRTIEVGARSWHQAEVLSGLEAGERVSLVEPTDDERR